ncbi:flavodoxin family protein [Candidatus Formimonas warabiya]|uniref:NADPH-dependent FMN reductase-like domain-containing protein n=1 Tax=Formimonas warabiya TaxID=1761012 RepID=A0A3G1KV78_FORW1|nr:flavodoxin family protein [Candidatus Formimonas warabiya]ATW26423.1 hypothetical protein DCMF_18175 [Candidatus Formimonas warabiya]
MKDVLVLGFSPRRNGNTDRMAHWANGLAKENGFAGELLFLRDLNFSPCIACGACAKDGMCHLKDDLTQIYPKIITSEKIVFAAPVFFQSLGALAKSFIDRMQCFWSAHHLLHREVVADPVLRSKRGLYALMCGATNLSDTFSCSEKLIKIFCATVETSYRGGTFVPGIDQKGDIDQETIKTKVITDVKSFFLHESS